MMRIILTLALLCASIAPALANDRHNLLMDGARAIKCRVLLQGLADYDTEKMENLRLVFAEDWHNETFNDPTPEDAHAFIVFCRQHPNDSLHDAVMGTDHRVR